MRDPEQRNSRALKKEWMDMCKKASIGWFRPIIVIINPNWLVVESAMIFLMSKWVVAAVAANTVVVAPRIKQRVVTVVLLCRIG